MKIRNSATYLSLFLVLLAMRSSGEESQKTPAQEFGEIEIPLIRFIDAHPIEVLNEIFSEAHKLRPDLKDVIYSFSPQPGLTSSSTPLITGSYRDKAVHRAFIAMNGLCKWSFYIDGNVYRFTNSKRFYSTEYWPDLADDPNSKIGD